MYSKLNQTNFPPNYKPMMVYDGTCGFCKYWIVKWQKITKDQVEYQPFQKVADQYKDIDILHFKQAVRFIDLEGKITSGPNAAYITYYLFSNPKFLHLWYSNKKWFRKMSDFAYNFISGNRSAMFDISRFLFGKDPNNYKPYWAYYLIGICIVFVSLIFFL